MLLLRLWNYIRGYVIIMVEGYFLEKFVNICIKRQIYLWDIKKKKNSKMKLKISIKGFRLLRPVARKTGCSVRIIEKKGIPFIISRYKERKTFILGSLVFVVLFYIMTSFVWTVEITGNEKVETELIMDYLDEKGIGPGILKYGVNTESLANSIIIEIDELSWVNVMIQGTKLKVNVAERVEPPKIIPKDVPCDVVASKDGIIESLIVKDGYSTLSEGDTVKKGDVLISGSIPILDEEDFRVVHAMGEVMARTWYENKQPIHLKVTEEIRTGSKKNNVSLMFFRKTVPFFHKEVDYEEHEEEKTKKVLSIGENLVLPFGIIVERYYENVIVEAKVSIEEAKEAAVDAAYNEILKVAPEESQIADKKVNFLEKDDGSIYADVIVECIENIGITKKIGGE
ncbi:sporulation protein YqfD [Herbivorax sp. ANBcel31]|uniref:sporulation protein YqfD n=1 Tax=Herbivorax sp. ANBcel31 TaxID=3069754 RepID=UPI0027B7FE82|nr:sporulation protein YqfD [Herbivorax sp. ANBcel31]MDQ2085979.1 sporulation protein YqfD [Herbivorax sp. ANBcel31]